MWIHLDDTELELVLGRLDVSSPEGIKLAQRIREDVKRQKDSTFDAYRNAVNVSDELECDDEAIVSPGGDPGAFVMTWTWVSNEEAGIEDDEEDEAA